MDLTNLKGKLSVITGGSSGIGYSIAQRIAEKGGDLLLVARNGNKLSDAAAKLSKISSSEVQVVSADVTNADDINRLRETVSSLAPCADIVVNSAGATSGGLVDEIPISEWNRLYNLNVIGLVRVIQALVPPMRNKSRQDGQERHIVNISSASGVVGVPATPAYGATKAAVNSLSESLRIQLQPYKIGVTAVCPSYVKTPLSETVQLFGSMDNPKIHMMIQERVAIGGLTPEEVADSTIEAISKNKWMIMVGRDILRAYLIKRIAPALLFRIMSKRIKAYIE